MQKKLENLFTKVQESNRQQWKLNEAERLLRAIEWQLEQEVSEDTEKQLSNLFEKLEKLEGGLPNDEKTSIRRQRNILHRQKKIWFQQNRSREGGLQSLNSRGAVPFGVFFNSFTGVVLLLVVSSIVLSIVSISISKNMKQEIESQIEQRVQEVVSRKPLQVPDNEDIPDNIEPEASPSPPRQLSSKDIDVTFHIPDVVEKTDLLPLEAILNPAEESLISNLYFFVIWPANQSYTTGREVPAHLKDSDGEEVSISAEFEDLAALPNIPGEYYVAIREGIDGKWLNAIHTLHIENSLKFLLDNGKVELYNPEVIGGKLVDGEWWVLPGSPVTFTLTMEPDRSREIGGHLLLKSLEATEAFTASIILNTDPLMLEEKQLFEKLLRLGATNNPIDVQLVWEPMTDGEQENLNDLVPVKSFTTRVGRVKEENANLRYTRDSTDEDNIVKTLSAETLVRLEEKDEAGNWLFVTTEDGQEGWLAASVLEVEEGLLENLAIESR